MVKRTNDKDLANYANEIEAKPIPGFEDLAPKEEPPKQKSAAQELEEAQEEKKQEIEHQKMSNGLGYIKVPLNTLPTQGLFYPVGTEIWIRAATGAEIRHWSLTNETELVDIDDALNYMLERCVTVRVPHGMANYRDLKEIDRFYIIFSIRDFTFPNGNNELMIKIDENDEIPLKKDNIDFIHLDDKVRQFYNEDKRCFVIDSYRIRSGKEIKLSKPLNIYMPSVGVTSFLKDYITRKTQRNEPFNKDFIADAPILLPDYHNLNDNSYAAFIAQCDYFGIPEYTIISWFKSIISENIKPKFVYSDKEGVEHTTPLNFQGGIKSLFLYTMDDII